MEKSKENKCISFTYESYNRGIFEINISEEEINERPAYKDIQIKFSVKIKNKDYPKWKVLINNPFGYISNIADKVKLIERLKDEIRIIINMDEMGEFNIEGRVLDLSNRQK